MFPFILVLTHTGCDSCRETADFCCPSTALCAWLRSASRCPWPSASSLRCLRYGMFSCSQGQMAHGAAGKIFTLNILHLTPTGPAGFYSLLSSLKMTFKVKPRGTQLNQFSIIFFLVFFFFPLADWGISPWAGDCHGNGLQSVDLQQRFMMKMGHKL